MPPPRGARGRASGLAEAAGAALGVAAAALALSRRGRGGGPGAAGAATVRGPLPPLLGEPPELPPDARPCASCSGTGKVSCFSCRGAGTLPPLAPLLLPPPSPPPYTLPPPLPGGEVGEAEAQAGGGQGA